MDTALKIPDDQYRQWIAELSNRYQRSQIKAATSVNREMLAFYWSLGRDVVEMKAESQWGSRFYDRLSQDLQRAIPNAKGLSSTNLKYMRRFYQLYSIRPQVVDELSLPSAGENHPQVADQLADALDPGIFLIPWGHHRVILDSVNADAKKALFYIRETIENNWSRAVLQNWLDTDLYERQGKAITNFALTLPAPQSDLAQEMTRDPYSFDFLTIRAQYDEKVLAASGGINGEGTHYLSEWSYQFRKDIYCRSAAGMPGCFLLCCGERSVSGNDRGRVPEGGLLEIPW